MSSSEIAIRVQNLSKAYTITHNAAKHSTLGETIIDRLKHPLRRPVQETFLALKDVNFDIKRGEVVGIVGRNGAGKSTLLKVLSRIAEPTTGQIDLYGRVGSLLEVGTGFHPELTGRENIYLNGAILGMRKKEITRAFDSIVEFSGTEQFLDTPVKRYSSGMYVRLAFAVAAHLDPEILIVDEVLAVGDAEFQKKCLGKMQDVAKSGRTVLFVSHNMAAVTNLCTTAIVMRRGTLDFHGPVGGAVERYLAGNSAAAGDGSLESFRPSWAKPFITSARLLNEDGQESGTIPMGTNMTVELSFSAVAGRRITRPVMGVVINHATLGAVGAINTRMTGFEVKCEAGQETGTLRCTLARPPLLQGHYSIDLWLGDAAEDVDSLAGYLQFDIEPVDIYGSGRMPFAHMGSIYLEPDWEYIPELSVAR